MGKASRKKQSKRKGLALDERAQGKVLISIVGEAQQRTIASFARMALEANNPALMRAVARAAQAQGENILDYQFAGEHATDGQPETVDIFSAAYGGRAFECLSWLTAEASKQDSHTFAKFAIELMGEFENMDEDDVYYEAMRKACDAVLRGAKEAEDTELAASLFDLVRRAGVWTREMLSMIEGEHRSRDESVLLDAVILRPAHLPTRVTSSVRL